MAFKQVYVVRPLFGCDPEFFFANPDGQVIGSELVITDKSGKLKYDDKFRYSGRFNDMSRRTASTGFIQMDGVQAEINPHPNTCRAEIGNEIGQCFETIKKEIAARGLKANFSGIVEVSKEQLDKLSESARKLGCAPSLNIYDKPSVKLATVDPVTYRKRSCGGHIHMSGANGLSDPKRMVPLLDALVGLPCVLVDRDPNMKERRELYGRAGEHRTPLATKGKGAELEYRTLSNFWLRSYQMMAFVMGLVRLSASVVQTGEDAKLLALVDRDKVIDAINDNDAVAARILWEKLKPAIAQMCPYGNAGDSLPLGGAGLRAFDYFADKGLDHWWSADGTVDRWATMKEGHGTGWEAFLFGTVAPQIPTTYVVQVPTVEAPVEVRDVVVETPIPEVIAVAPAPLAEPKTYHRGPDGRFAPRVQA